jgi:preprotein translocase subunit SecF
MELIKPGTKIDFVHYTAWAIGFSWLLIAIGALSLLLHGGPNYGVDFSGGTVMQVRFKQKPSISDIRGTLEPLGLGDVTIQDFGTSEPAGSAEFLIRLPQTADERSDLGTKVTEALQGKFGKDAFELLRVEMVGPRVGADLRTRAVLAVAFATLMMGAYIWFRFELRFGIGAAVALIHDVLITIGALSLFNYEFDLTVVAALLTVVGFSVNDTVIVSDRIRENMRKRPRDPLAAIINSSINETLSRTILTAGTAILVIVALFFLGGNVIHGFAFALLIGFSIGTYSSIYVASPIVLYLERGTARRRR